MFSHQELFLFCSDLLESILLGQKNLFLSFLFFFFNMVPGQWSSELTLRHLNILWNLFTPICSQLCVLDWGLPRCRLQRGGFLTQRSGKCNGNGLESQQKWAPIQVRYDACIQILNVFVTSHLPKRLWTSLSYMTLLCPWQQGAPFVLEGNKPVILQKCPCPGFWAQLGWPPPTVNAQSGTCPGTEALLWAPFLCSWPVASRPDIFRP